MSKKKHIWHCGLCHTDCKVLKKEKGTKYIYCPNCDTITSYYNPIPLVAAAISLAPKALKLGKKAAAVVGIGGKDSSEKKEKKEIQYIDSKDKPNYSERVINKVLYGE